MDNDKSDSKGERIAKVMARAGVCSRREAERMIAEGRVSVDGQVIDSPALNVLDHNIIVVDGKALPDRQPPRLWRYHKPRGLITSHNDPEGRPTVFEQLPKWVPRVISVGRLDFNTEGLLLLTNDGELARYLEKPETGFLRRYRVRVHGRVDENQLEALQEGPVIDGIQYGPVEAILDIQKGANAWINVAIREGKNREVRKVMESLGLEVSRLIRTDYGPVQLGKMPRGEMEEIPRKALAEWFGGLVPGIEPLRKGPQEGFAKAKERDGRDQTRFKGPRARSDKADFEDERENRFARKGRSDKAGPGAKRPPRGGKIARVDRDADTAERTSKPIKGTLSLRNTRGDKDAAKGPKQGRKPNADRRR